MCDAHQVHAVPRTRDETRVRQRIHRTELLEWHRLVQIMNRNKLNRPESTVDSAHELVDAGSEVLVLFDILSRGNGQLDKNALCVS